MIDDYISTGIVGADKILEELRNTTSLESIYHWMKTQRM
jgi:hypothetical protein